MENQQRGRCSIKTVRYGVSEAESEYGDGRFGILILTTYYFCGGTRFSSLGLKERMYGYGFSVFNKYGID